MKKNSGILPKMLVVLMLIMLSIAFIHPEFCTAAIMSDIRAGMINDDGLSRKSRLWNNHTNQNTYK